MPEDTDQVTVSGFEASVENTYEKFSPTFTRKGKSSGSITDIGEYTVSVKSFDITISPDSARTVNVYSPDDVGIPESCPELLKFNPEGRAELSADHVMRSSETPLTLKS